MSQITGYLDAVTDHALIGWIADFARPGHLEPVTCRGQDGSERTFLPFLPRQDVCEAFGCKGRFGFAIPLHLLRGLGPTITLHDATGAALPNATRIVLPPLPTPPSGPCRVVLHIQKTAGTSLRSAMTASSQSGEDLFLYPDGYIGLTPDELATLPEPQRAALRLVMGHVYFGIADLLPGRPEYVTFLREPEARLRSHYFHHLAEGVPIEGSRFGRDLPSTVSQGTTEEFDNLMVRMIAGAAVDTVPLGAIEEAHVDLALHNIRTVFRFVGIVERMSAHYPALCRTLQVQQPPLSVENTSRITDAEDHARRVDWPEVMHRNRFDVMFYQRVQAEGLAGRDLAIPARHSQKMLSHA